MRQPRHFDWIAPFYDRLASEPDRQELAALLALPADGPLVEVGGGTGRVAAAVASMVPLCVVCDPSIPMARRASSKKGLSALRGSASSLPFATGSAARVLVSDALHHFPDQPAALREMARILAPGGRLLILEPDIRRWAVKIVALGETLAGMGSHMHTPLEIVAMAEAAGLRATAREGRRLSVSVVAVKPDAA